MLVGRDDTRIVASVLVGPRRSSRLVYYVAVDPDCRHKGYGRVVMDAAEHWLRCAASKSCSSWCVRQQSGSVVLSVARLLEQERIIYAKCSMGASRHRNQESQHDMTVSDRIRVQNVRVLSDHHSR